MRRLLLSVSVGLAGAGAAPTAWASTASGLAIDTWLHSALASFAGPVAYAAVLVGVVVAGARLVSGGDLHGFLRTLIMLTVIAGLTFGGRTVIDMMSANAAIVRAAAVPPANPLHAERPTR